MKTDPDNLESVKMLLSALDYFYMEEDHILNTRGTFFQFVVAVDFMLDELCSEENLSLAKQLTLGKKKNLLEAKGIFPEKISHQLNSLVTLRNMVTHALHDSRMELTDLHLAKQQTLSIFDWYLTECELGPLLSVDDIESYLESIGPKKTMPLVFLCYATEDKGKVEILYQKLRQRRFKPWMDKKDLLPGQNWEFEINQTIRNADFFIACISSHSVSKKGFVQKEVRFALDVLGEIPPGRIFLIPVRLEPCKVPVNLEFLHWIDLDSEEAYEKLFMALEGRQSPAS